MTIAQHKHDVSHPTYCGLSGKARLHLDGVFDRDVEAGHAAPVRAGVNHEFEAWRTTRA
jgi:quercetin dioxygenase-like cupin family protein